MLPMQNRKPSLLLLPVVLAFIFSLLLAWAGKGRTEIHLDAAVSGLLLGLMVWVCMNRVFQYPIRAGIMTFGLIIGLAGGTVAVVLDYYILKLAVSEQPEFLQWLRQSLPTRTVVALTVTSWMTTLAAMQRKNETLDEQLQQTSDASTLKRDAELFKLRQQLQPHFLYNSLNSINALIMTEPEKAQEMVGKLSDFLRSSVRREGKEWIELEEELAYISSYLAIEGVRFEDRLTVDIRNEIEHPASLPPFLLQPIIENAIKFGLYGNTGKVTITFRISLQERKLLFEVTNPVDEQSRPPAGTGFGLEAVRRRLYLLFARMDLLETRTENGLFTTTLKIPQPHVQSDPDR